MDSIKNQSFWLYLATLGNQVLEPVFCSNLETAYHTLDDGFSKIEPDSWILFSLEHQPTGEVFLCQRCTAESWRVYGDTFHIFQTYLDYFSPDFEKRIAEALAQGAPTHSTL